MFDLWMWLFGFTQEFDLWRNIQRSHGENLLAAARNLRG